MRINSPVKAQRAQKIMLFAIITAGAGATGYNVYGDWVLKVYKSPQSELVPPAGSVRQQLPIRQLVEAHLFGHARQSATAESIETTIAPETRLRLQLRGVFAHSDQTQSRVLIAEQGKSAKYYRLGDSLSGDAILHAVATEHVILNRKGQLETLSFAANKSASGNRQVTTRKDPSDKMHSFAPEPTADSTTKIASTKKRTESIKDRLTRLREARDL